jgi:tetratricopeptide (TPR) repeat protein
MREAATMKENKPAEVVEEPAKAVEAKQAEPVAAAKSGPPAVPMGPKPEAQKPPAEKRAAVRQPDPKPEPPRPAEGPLSAAELHRMGREELNARNLPEAVRLLSEAVKLNPRFAQAWNGLAYAQMLSGQYREALVALDRALEVDPGYINALQNRAAVRRRLGDTQGADADAARAAELLQKR